MSNDLKNEKLQILTMVKEGKITSSEGVELLNALENKSLEINNKSSKWIKIRVIDPSDKTKVNVNVPIALVDIGLKLATKVSPDLKDSGVHEINIQEIAEIIKSGAEGKIVDIESENGEKVEIVVE